MAMGLTPKQAEMLLLIRMHIDAHGVAPSFSALREAAQLHSSSGVARILKALEERGYIRRIPGKARAIEIIDQVPNKVALNSEILTLATRYAREHGISLDTAVNESLRQFYGAAA